MKNKFKKGRKIRTLGVLVAHLRRGGWVYWNHKPLHPGWMISMSLQTILAAILRGLLRKAISTETPMPF